MAKKSIESPIPPIEVVPLEVRARNSWIGELDERLWKLAKKEKRDEFMILMAAVHQELRK